MGLINVYNSVTNEHTTKRANGVLKDILPDFDFKHSVTLKAGNRLDPDYVVEENDVIYVRVIPGEAATVGIIIGVIAIISAGVAVGCSIYANKKSEEAKKDLENAQKQAKDLAASTNTLPFIQGAKNVSALGRNVQFLMGKMYNTPYNVTNGFYSIDGANGVNSYYNAVLSCGFGNQKITEIYIGSEKIKVDEDGINGVNEFDTESLYYDAKSNRVEVEQSGNVLSLTNCNQKVDATYSGAELKHDYGEDAEPIIVQAAENAQKIQVCIQFSCLRQYDSEADDGAGNWVERTATVRPYWSNDGGTTWNEFYFNGMGNNSITINTNHTIRFVATKEFSPAESLGKSISIKVVKETPKAESNSQEDCALLWYQTFCYDVEKSTENTLVACTPLEEELYNKTTRVAFRMTASSSTDSVLDELHVIAEGYARTWNGTSWNTTKEPTRNPAAWILEILTSPIHKASKFNDNEIDLNSLGALYEYCENNQFFTDGLITSEIKKSDLIEKILSSVNADMIINSDGLYEFMIDKEEDTPVALLNTENISSITYSKDFSRKVDGRKVTFTNRDSWQVDTFYSMIDGDSYDYTKDNVTDLSPDYVTTYEHAYKMAQRKEREAQLMPRTIKADVGNEGDYYPLFSTVLLQIPALLQGLNSSVVKSYTEENGLVTSITISDLVTFKSGTRYGIIIQCSNDTGFKLLSLEVTGDGSTRTLTIVSPFSASDNYLTIGNHLSFGILDSSGQFTKITNTMKIYGIEPNGNDGYVLTLKDYNEAVYQYGGTIPAYKSNLTKRQAPDNSVTIDDVNNVRQEMNNMQDLLIEAYKRLMMPIVVDADVKTAIFEIDEDGYTAAIQTITTNITCKQGDENRSFAIGSIALPDGWTMAVSGGRITFTIGEGVRVTSGQIRIPVVYRPIVEYNEYVDENGNPYVDESNNAYMEAITSSTSTTYNIYLTYFGLGNGVYLGMFTDVSQIPESTNLNDYFTWGGANHTVYSKSVTGELLQARVYKYVGSNKGWSWEQDTNGGHGQAALSDVLGIANADLQNNNSTAWEYLDHLTANSIYVDMIVANSAFIEKISAKVITSDIVTTGQLDDAVAKSELETAANVYKGLGVDTLADYTLISGGYIKTSLINAKAITIGSLNTDSVNQFMSDTMSNTFKSLGVDTLTDYTIISGGKIKTGLIDADAIKATAGFFDNINVTGIGYFNALGFIGITAGSQAINHKELIINGENGYSSKRYKMQIGFLNSSINIRFYASSAIATKYAVIGTTIYIKKNGDANASNYDWVISSSYTVGVDDPTPADSSFYTTVTATDYFSIYIVSTVTSGEVVTAGIINRLFYELLAEQNNIVAGAFCNVIEY